jgi:hypothetical protein
MNTGPTKPGNPSPRTTIFWTAVGIGLAMGMAIGIAVGDITIGIAIGVAIGVALGSGSDGKPGPPRPPG